MVWQEGQHIHNHKYLIEKYLGGGGFAVTYKAVHTNLNRPVVIKTPNQNVQNDPEYPKYVERFIKEGQMLAQVCSDSHPHIVQVIDLFEEDGLHCMVMQYIPGQSLWDLVQTKGRLSEASAVKYIQQIARALVEVHQKGIFHLDVTPPNIMIAHQSEILNSDKAVLIDFGIAGDMSPPSTLSRSFGNRAFAPYELIRKGSRHPTVDIYCLAASFYYAVTGKLPTSSFDRMLGDELIPPQQLVQSLSNRVTSAIVQGMALEANDRPQTMLEHLNLFSEKHSVNLLDDVGGNYSKLEELLKKQQWRQADKETIRLMFKVAKREKAGFFDYKSIENFPCTDLRIIDQLWAKYSNGRFGFSVQKRIWLECGGEIDYKTEKSLGDRLGWRKNNSWLLPYELKYTLNAPLGHLPAVGAFEVVAGVGWWAGRIEGNSYLASRLAKCNI